MGRGLLGEVRTLKARRDLHAGLPSIRIIGYRQLWEHLEGRVTLEAAAERAVIATRQLARRQLTWLRAEPAADWFDPVDGDLAGTVGRRIAGWLANR